MNIQSLKEKIYSSKSERDLLLKQSEVIQGQLIDLKRFYESSLKARALIQDTGRKTQQQIEYHISSIVTTAIVSVFEEDIEFKVEFVERRGKTEADFWFIKNNEKIKPISSSGGGLLDITSFALRISFWNLRKTRKVMIFDEPMRFLSKDLVPKAVEMIKMLSDKLGIQVIMVSHIPDFIDGSDKNFVIENGKLVKEFYNNEHLA
jgi:DNA repair exonuclease SbcCD ATPase subunit